MKFKWQHIDTCLSCFLVDHHNRDGELLLGVYVDGESIIKDVLTDLRNELQCFGYDLGSGRAGYNHEEAKAALDRFFDDISVPLDSLFDPSLEIPDGHPDDIDGEACQAWFLLTWDVNEEGGEAES